MKTKRKRGLLFAFLFFSALMSRGQDPYYAHHYSSVLYINPAFTGNLSPSLNRPIARASLSYKNQWPVKKNGLQTLNFSLDKVVYGLDGGLGLMFNRTIEGRGLLTRTEISVPYSYTIRISPMVIARLGIQVSYNIRSIDLHNLWIKNVWNSPTYTQSFKYDRNQPLPSSRVKFFNYAIGGLINNPKFYLGFAGHNIFEPNQSFYASPSHYLSRRISIMGGAKLPFKRWGKAFLYPDFLYRTQYLDAMLKVGANMSVNKWVTGLHAALINESFTGTVNLGFRSKQILMLYSLSRMDIPLSPTKQFGYSHDVSLRYLFGKSRHRRGCPGSGDIFPIL